MFIYQVYYLVFMFLMCYLFTMNFILFIFILQGLTVYHSPVMWAPCVKTVIIMIIVMTMIIIKVVLVIYMLYQF